MDSRYPTQVWWIQNHEPVITSLTIVSFRFNTCQESIKIGTQEILAEQGTTLDELLAQQISATLLLNNTVELGEKLYPSTSTEGREAISLQLQELQRALEALYDGINSTEMELKAKLSR